MNSENIDSLKFQLKAWLYKKQNQIRSRTMQLTERMAIFIANILPREVAYWTFIRVVTEDYKEYPGEQKVSEVQMRWIRNSSL